MERDFPITGYGLDKALKLTVTRLVSNFAPPRQGTGKIYILRLKIMVSPMPDTFLTLKGQSRKL
jgi:hypothetical protein